MMINTEAHKWSMGKEKERLCEVLSPKCGI